MSFVGNVVATAVGVLRLDTGQVDQGVDQAGQALTRLTDISRQSYFGLRNLGIGFEAVGTAALGVVAASTAAATAWESGNARIEATSLGSAAAVRAQSTEVNQFKLQLEGIADSTPVPIKSIQEVGNEVAKLGVGLNQIAPDTKEIIDLNQLTGTSYDTLTTGIGKATISLGLGSDGIKRFGSTIFDLQRNVPATTEDILTLTNRLAGVGVEAGIPEQGLLAISAAVASVGGNVRTNASALQKFIADIVTAVQTGGGALNTFATLAGAKDAKAFADAWGKDPTDALGSVLAGLGRVNAAQGEGQAILQSVGLTQATQIDSLLKIADAQNQTVGGSISIANANALATQSWQAGNSVQQASALIYGTTASRLAELKNQVQLTAVNFGAVFLPELRAVSGFMTNVVAGFEALPGPIQTVGGVLITVVGGVAAFAGFLLLLLPRVLLARLAVEQLSKALQNNAEANAEAVTAGEGAAEVNAQVAAEASVAAEAETELGAAGEVAAEGETFLTAAARQTVAALIGITGVAPEVVVAEEEIATGAEEAGTAMNLAFAGIPALIGLLTIGVVGLDQLGAAHRRDAQAALADGQANESLIAALQQEASGTKGATDAWILHQLAISGALELMQKIGFSAKESTDFVKGSLDPARAKEFTDALQNTAASGAKWVQPIIDKLKSLNSEYFASVQSANALAKADNQDADAATASGNAADLAGNKIETAAQKQQKAAQAAASYGQELLSHAQAVLSLQQAYVTLSNAADDLAHKDLLLQQAQEQVAIAQINGRKAVVDLADAQFDLDHAQQEQAFHLTSATQSVESAELAHRQAIQSVADAQANLNKALDPSVSVTKLRDAYKDLRDAQESVHQSQQGVEDAQWQLNYLMGEGASSRDIQEARDALQAAQTKAQDAADKVADATAKVKKAQDNTDAANAQADAQLALEAAQQSVLTTESDLEQKQIDLNKAQLDASNNATIIGAQVALQQANNQVTQSHVDEYRAIESVQAIQNGSLERAYATAQNGVETAIYQVATSAVNLQKDLAEMRGETYTDTQYAQALAGELGNLGAQASGPIATQIGVIASAINNAKDRTNDFIGAVGGANTQLGNTVGNSAAIQAALENATPNEHHTSWWHALGTEIGKAADAVGNFFDRLSQGTLGKAANWFESNILNPLGLAEGALVTRPTLALVGEAGPEVVLPLNDPVRMQQILAQAGAAGFLAGGSSGFTASAPLQPVSTSSGGASSSSVTHQYGDFAPTIISNADPDDMMREYTWRHRVLSRSAG